MVNKQVLIIFAIGKYKDEVLCDVVPMEGTQVLLERPWHYDILHDGHTNKISFDFQGHKIMLKPLSPKEVNADQIKMKTKRENKKNKERKDKMGINTSPPFVKTIMLTRTKIQTAPPRCSYFLSFSLPNHSKYLTSLIKKFRDDIQKPHKDSHLLRGFSPSKRILTKKSFYPQIFFSNMARI